MPCSEDVCRTLVRKDTIAHRKIIREIEAHYRIGDTSLNAPRAVMQIFAWDLRLSTRTTGTLHFARPSCAAGYARVLLC
jgi:hypothetical protein